MAQNTIKTLTAFTWTQLTNADITSITFQNVSDGSIIVAGTTGATAPVAGSFELRYEPGDGELNVLLADLFPGITAVRVWALGGPNAKVSVSHA